MATPTQGQCITQLEEQLMQLLASQAVIQQENANLQAAQATIQTENNRLQTTVEHLRHREDSPATFASSATSSHRTHEPKVAQPEFYQGHRSKLTTFITQVKMVIKLQPTRFPTEASKVLYAGSFLRDIAFLWFQPFVAAEQPPQWLDSFEDFCKELHITFGDPVRG